ncbi:MAG: hypothetical protein HN350_09310 [Phycisphaerales bacterium]|jgi:hypothetical protein|nr:hypothetical protein [Phycisphaerales bacterium]
MNSSLRIKIAPLLMALIAITAMSGCTRDLHIVKYPIFWDHSLRNIAVTPFQNATQMPYIGTQVSSDLATQLQISGSYDAVYDRAQLAQHLSEQELQIACGGDPNQAAAAMSKVPRVQAILSGVVTTCNWPHTRRDTTVTTERVRGRRGRIHIRHIEHHVYTNEAEIKANASLVRITPSGPQTVHAAPVHAYVKSEGEIPELTRDACLTAAREQILQALLNEFAITPMTIRVEPSETFFTAAGQPYAGKWPKSKKFSISQDRDIVLTLILPKICERNKFTITVSRKDALSDLINYEVFWTNEMTTSPAGKQFVFNPAELAKTGGGPGDYVFRLYTSRPTPDIEHKIKIEP